MQQDSVFRFLAIYNIYRTSVDVLNFGYFVPPQKVHNETDGVIPRKCIFCRILSLGLQIVFENALFYHTRGEERKGR